MKTLKYYINSVSNYFKKADYGIQKFLDKITVTDLENNAPFVEKLRAMARNIPALLYLTIKGIIVFTRGNPKKATLLLLSHLSMKPRLVIAAPAKNSPNTITAICSSYSYLHPLLQNQPPHSLIRERNYLQNQLSDLKARIEKLEITTQESEKFTTVEKSNLEILKNAIKENLAKVLPSDLMLKAFDLAEFAIIIIPRQLMSERLNAHAVTVLDQHAIYICADVPKEQVLKTLKNEFHTLAIYATNREYAYVAEENLYLYGMPYVTKELKVDNQQLTKLENAIENGIKNLEDAMKKNPKKLETLFQDYVNEPRHTIMSKKDFAKYKHIKDNIYQTDPITKIQILNKVDYKDQNKVGITWMYVNDNFFTKKINIILEDLRKRQVRFKESDQLYEMASTIDELPEGVKEKYFGEFCEFFNEFYGIPDYCRPYSP